MPGHNAISASTNGQYQIKVSSQREKFIYENAPVFWGGDVLPQFHPSQPPQLPGLGDGTFDTITLDDEAVINLATPISFPPIYKRVIVIDTVGYDNEVNPRKICMDVKIGYYTKSGEQYKLEEPHKLIYRGKLIQHDLMDLAWYSSRQNGYFIYPSNKVQFDRIFNLALSGQEPNLKPAMLAILNQITAIADLTRPSIATFVGSSLFIVLNLVTPTNSQVRLIDPDHPIITITEEDLALNYGVNNVPNDVMTYNRIPLNRNPPVYIQKWTNNFNNGLASFNTFFQAKHNLLP